APSSPRASLAKSAIADDWERSLPWNSGSVGKDNMTKNPLIELAACGQSVWLDQMRRSLLTSGELKRLVEQDGLRGMTSNPTIFEKAIGGSADYDSEMRELAAKGASVNEVYEKLVVEDIVAALDVLRPVYDQSGGHDGFVS